MKILVTGGTGFLGSYLVNKLLNDGNEVIFIGRNEKKAKELEDIGAKFLKLDLVNLDYKLRDFKDIDFVFHCAAKSSPWGKYKDFYNSNVVATKNIINLCKFNKVKRLVYVSTPSIYFNFRDRLDIKETDVLPNKMVNYYAQTKYLAEKEIDKAYKDGMEVVTIRPRGIFGNGDTSILPRLIRANKKRFIPIISDKIIVDVCYVENVVDALILCMNAKNHVLGKKYNITNDENINLNHFVKNIIEKLGGNYSSKKINYNFAICFAVLMEFIGKYLLFGKEPPLTKYTVGILSKSQTLDISSAKKDLGYEPKYSVDYGVDILVKGGLYEC